jgi:hypothetical protein
VLFIGGSRYVDLILYEERLDQFPPGVELSFWSLALLPVAMDLFFRPSLVITNNSDEYYAQFNLQKIWLMYFWRLLIFALVEHTSPLLRPPCLWSPLLVGTAARFRSGAIPR